MDGTAVELQFHPYMHTRRSPT